MKVKALHIVSALSFIAVAQLLFFWLVPTGTTAFVSIYPFYTVLTTAHTALLTFISIKYKYPAGFAPSFCGSIVIAGEIIAGLLLGLLCSSIRTILFAQSIITVVYILVMAFFCSVAAKEAVDSTVPVTPVQPYSTNDRPAVVPTNTPQRRMPRAVTPDVNR